MVRNLRLKPFNNVSLNNVRRILILKRYDYQGQVICDLFCQLKVCNGCCSAYEPWIYKSTSALRLLFQNDFHVERILTAVLEYKFHFEMKSCRFSHGSLIGSNKCRILTYLKNQTRKFTLEITNLKRVALLSIYMNISTSETALKTCVNEISNLVLNFSLVMNILPCEQTYQVKYFKPPDMRRINCHCTCTFV